MDAFEDVGGFWMSLPPYASLDVAVLSSGSSVSVDALANDHDANGHALTIESFDPSSVVLQGNVTGWHAEFHYLVGLLAPGPVGPCRGTIKRQAAGKRRDR